VILSSHKAIEFVYASPPCGFAQVALAFAAKLTGKNVTIFVSDDRQLHPFTKQAQRMAAKIQTVRDEKREKGRKEERGGPIFFYLQVHAGTLAKIQHAALDYVNRRQKESSVEWIPFGLLSQEFVWTLQYQIKKSLPPNFAPKRMWIVYGSGIERERERERERTGHTKREAESATKTVL
jgi:hypothetical protein